MLPNLRYLTYHAECTVILNVIHGSGNYAASASTSMRTAESILQNCHLQVPIFQMQSLVHLSWQKQVRHGMAAFDKT